MPVKLHSRYPGREEWSLDDGSVLISVHPESDECRECGCALHNPTDHEHTNLPLHWDKRRGILIRVNHEQAFDDPDELAFRERHPEYLLLRHL